jgi:hypothetical protein
VWFAEDSDPAAATWVRDLATWRIASGDPHCSAVPEYVFNLHARLFHDDRDGTLDALLHSVPERWAQDGVTIDLLQRLANGAPDGWPEAPSRRMMALLGSVLRDAQRHGAEPLALHWYFKPLLGSLARTIAPAVALQSEAPWAALALPDWRAPLDQFFDTVRFRHETTLSFQEQA